MGVSYRVDIFLWDPQQIWAEVEAFLETGEFVEGCFDGLGWEGAVGFRFDQGAGNRVPKFDEARLEGRRRDLIGRCTVGRCCERMVEPSGMASKDEPDQAKE